MKIMSGNGPIDIGRSYILLPDFSWAYLEMMTSIRLQRYQEVIYMNDLYRHGWLFLKGRRVSRSAKLPYMTEL